MCASLTMCASLIDMQAHFTNRPSLKNPEQEGGSPMLLRDHPLMSYRGVRNWPPVWIWTHGRERVTLRGEIGTLIEVRHSPVTTHSLLLDMRHQGSEYLGCLLFGDPAFCRQMATILRRHIGRPIAEIGSLELLHTL